LDMQGGHAGQMQGGGVHGSSRGKRPTLEIHGEMQTER
jgi:hypothetical protein